MDGLGRAVGDGISGLVGGALNSIGAAVSGIVSALAAALPAGALPVLGVLLVLVVGWLLARR